MNTGNQHSKQADFSTKSASAGLLAAIIASLCCITPVISFVVGISGIAASFSWLEPLRPYLIVLTLGVLAFGWYLKLKPRTQEEIDCTCEEDDKPSFLQSRGFLGLVTIFAALMLAFPSYSHLFYPKSGGVSTAVESQQSQIRLVEFKVKGMTCPGCELHINNAVGMLVGVVEVKASYEDQRAVVKYDPEKVSEEQIVKAINKTGYEVIEKSSDQY